MRLSQMSLQRTGQILLMLMLGHVLAAGGASAYWDGDNPFELDENGQPLYAIRTPNIFYHNVGLLEMLVTNVGVVGNPFWGLDTFGAGWKGGEYLYAASLWIGAIASDNLAYVSTGAYAYELRPSLDPIDTIYPAFEGATGGDRAGFSTSGGDDDADGVRDEDPLNGKDDDGDGSIDEDYAAISQQMFSCEYWDYTEQSTEAYPEHRPLHIRVTQNSYAWSTEGANEFVGLDYEIVNDGFEILREIYLGYFVDSDAGRKDAQGYFSDDGGELRSIDTTYVNRQIEYTCTDADGTFRECNRQPLNLDIAYMRDTPGDQPGGNAADDMGPGANGYFGGMFLGHTTDPFGERAPTQVEIHTMRFFSGGGTYPEGDPRNDFERYDLLSSGDKPRRPTSQPADYRYCFSAGPFKELLPGERLYMQVAFVIGNEWQGLLENALNAQRIYNGDWRDTDANVETGCEGRETCLHIEPGGEPLFWNNPCDSLAPAEGPIKNTDCNHPDYWRNDDCDCCTPLQSSSDPLDCDGKETLIHWVGTVAPPSPTVSTEDPALRARVEGDRRVKIEWDNGSELVADPLRGEILFCGYRIWRVEGWDRPIGATGPSPDEWQLVADLNVEPVGSQVPLDSLTNPYSAIVDTIPSPIEEGAWLYRYEIGRYFYEDTLGLKNGMLYFYDVTAYSCWLDDDGNYVELSSFPAAGESEGVQPLWAAVTDGSWKDHIMVVPNPWSGGAAWDLTPSASDPTGSHIDFAGLPDKLCDVRIYTMAGDLVETLTHDGTSGSGTARWNMLSRNGQDISSGVYLYSVTCANETVVGRFTVVR